MIDENDTPEVSEESQRIPFESKLGFLRNKYYFHDLMKESEGVKHYVVEDLENEYQVLSNDYEPSFFYLKQ